MPHATTDGLHDVLTVNGKRVDEPYVKKADSGIDTRTYDVKVAPGRMFLMGDNRGISNDSRYFPSDHSGTVPTSAVQGRALESDVVPGVLGLATVLAALLAVGGGICVLVGGLNRRRARRARAFNPWAPGFGVDGPPAPWSGPGQ